MVLNKYYKYFLDDWLIEGLRNELNTLTSTFQYFFILLWNWQKFKTNNMVFKIKQEVNKRASSV